MVKVSKEDCLNEISRLYELYGKVTKQTFKEHGRISYDSVRRRFGSISTALKELNIVPSDGQRKMIPKDVLIADLIKVHNEHGYISKPLYEKEGQYNRKVVVRIFGNFENMYNELNLNRHPSGIVNTNDELLDDLKRMHDEFGIVTAKHVKEYGKYSLTAYHDRFGCINQAYKAAGLEQRQPGQSSFADWVIKRIGIILNEEPEYEKRFDWLRSPATNRHLPIDGYFPQSNIAIEYNGPQHYHLVNHYHETDNDLYYRQVLDELKYRMIREKGIKLLVIDYREPTTIEYLTNKIRA